MVDGALVVTDGKRVEVLEFGADVWRAREAAFPVPLCWKDLTGHEELVLDNSYFGIDPRNHKFWLTFESAPAEDLCRKLPGNPRWFAIPPSLNRAETRDRLLIACIEQGATESSKLRLDFTLYTEPSAQLPDGGSAYDFRWGANVGNPSDNRGQFNQNPMLCEDVKKLIEQTRLTSAGIHIISGHLGVDCSPDARWGTSLNFRLELNRPRAPLDPQTSLKLLSQPAPLKEDQ